MGRKSIFILIIATTVLILLALGVYNHVSFHKQDYKSAQHVYAGKYCVLIVPENWKDSVPAQMNSGSFIHLASGGGEAWIDIGVDTSGAFNNTVIEAHYQGQLPQKYSKTNFNQFGNYAGTGHMTEGKFKNKNEGYFKIFVYSDSMRSFYIAECNTEPGLTQVKDDLRQIETSFRLK
jgi:hypothetical protein